MKWICLLIICCLPFHPAHAQSVGIGTNTPSSSAALDVRSTNKGFLPPRLSLAQRNTIVNPEPGLTIWCLDCTEMQTFDGLIWKNAIGGAACLIPQPPSVTICGKVWLLKNLDVDKYRNGDIIPKVTDPTTWINLTTGAWCWFNNDSATYAAVYGKLYNWYAVNDPRGLAPFNWHVPSDSEWLALGNCVGGIPNAAKALKEAGTIHWFQNPVTVTNSSGFTAVPGGHRNEFGNFELINAIGFHWTSSLANPPFMPNTAHTYTLYNNQPHLERGSFPYNYGLSVRCIRDF